MLNQAETAAQVIAPASLTGAFALTIALSSREDAPMWMAKLGLGLVGTSVAAWMAQYPLHSLRGKALAKAAAARQFAG